MADHVVLAQGGRAAHPIIVATDRAQRGHLVREALRDPGHTGIHARTHHLVRFYVEQPPIMLGERWAKNRYWMEVGFFAGFGAVLFVDDPRPPGDSSTTDEDWAWIARHERHIHGLPAVYYDQETLTQFPPRMVMTIDMVRDVVLEWVETGRRPESLEWVPVNSFRWKLDGLGDLAESPDMA